MKAITIHQPWASLIAIGAKHYETRSWATKYRGPITIHASKKEALLTMWRLPKETTEAVFETFKNNADLNFSFLNRGCVLLVADLTNVYKTEELNPSKLERMFGDWTPGRYAWELQNVRVLPSPVLAKGKQGLWNWNEEETACH